MIKMRVYIRFYRKILKNIERTKKWGGMIPTCFSGWFWASRHMFRSIIYIYIYPFFFLRKVVFFGWGTGQDRPGGPGP